MRKHAVLLINLGTPSSPSNRDVYRYLIEFLTDGRVIDMPWWKRQLLVRGLIVPARYRNTAESYRAIWGEQGSPLLYYGNRVVHLLQEKLGSHYDVRLAMRYQQPSLEVELESIRQSNPDQLTVIPLFPQYASATTGSIYQKVMECLRTWEVMPKMHFVSQYPDNSLMVQAFVEKAKKHPVEDFDHYVFSFHGLPVRHLTKADLGCHCQKKSNCCVTKSKENAHCYSAQCHLTASSLIKALALDEKKTSVTFQSRLGKEPWLEPYTSEVLHSLAKQGKKRVLIFSPAFVADCLETIYELGVEYKGEFIAAGGEELQYVESLNDSPTWVECLEKMIRACEICKQPLRLNQLYSD